MKDGEKAIVVLPKFSKVASLTKSIFLFFIVGFMFLIMVTPYTHRKKYFVIKNFSKYKIYCNKGFKRVL